MMFRKHSHKIQTALLVVVIFVTGFVLGNLNFISLAQSGMIGDLDQAFSPLRDVYDTIRQRYVDSAQISVPELVDGAIAGMVESLDDDYSEYLDPEAYTVFNADLSGNVEGIGVVIRTIEETGEIVVASLIKGAAAQAAGVLPGDIFYEVDGKRVTDMTQSELAGLVRGPAGTDVNIKFKRGEDIIDFTITRVRFEVPIVESEVLDGNIAYISFAEFNPQGRSRLEEALNALDVNNRAGLILDLRGNPGGLLSSAVDVGSLFIPEGVLLYEAYGDGSEDTFTVSGDNFDLSVPMVLLVDENSASASELFAGAIKDYKLATIMGETTFGKGTVQTIQPLSNGGGLRLTIARWLTPNRNWIQDFGVTPDITVEWNPEPTDILPEDALDPQLQAAVDFLTK